MQRPLGRVVIAVATVTLLGACTAAVGTAGGDRVVQAPVVGNGTGGSSEGGTVRLVDVTERVGLDFVHGAFAWDVSADPAAMMAGGACWLDADGDGWLDLYLVNTWAESEHGRWVAEGGLPKSTLFHNDAGMLRDVGDESGAALTIRGEGCLAADLDADGATDLLVTSARTSALLWNDGDGTFTADDGSAGLNVYGWHSAAVAGDVDGDGLVDVFIGGYVDTNTRLPEATAGFPRTHAPVRDLLLRNTGPAANGHAAFEVVADGGVDPDGARYTLGASFSDVDGDGDLDLLVANDTDPNRLYRNDSSPGRFSLVDVADDAGADDDNSGMGVAVGDLDGNLRPDVLVTNMGDQGHTLLTNGGLTNGGLRAGPLFRDARAALGVPGLGDGLTGWGASFVDLDLDGDLDVVMANGAIPVTDLAADGQPIAVHLAEDGRLLDGAAQLGLDHVTAMNGRGMAVADYDNDGDPDLVIVDVGGRARLLRNSGPTAGWLVVDPLPRTPGTRVVAELSDGRQMVREVRAGGSYLSTEDPRALFGLGADGQVARLQVIWPDGATAQVTRPARDQLLVVAQP